MKLLDQVVVLTWTPTWLELEETWDTLAEIIAQFVLTHTTSPACMADETRSERRQRQRQLQDLEKQLMIDCKRSMDYVPTY